MSKEFSIGNMIYFVSFHESIVRIWKYQKETYPNLPDGYISFPESNIELGTDAELKRFGLPSELQVIIKKIINNKVFW